MNVGPGHRGCEAVCCEGSLCCVWMGKAKGPSEERGSRETTQAGPA